MKCPKCGSEMYVKFSKEHPIKGGVHYVTEKDFSCYDKNCPNNETYETRLEKVLYKFEFCECLEIEELYYAINNEVDILFLRSEEKFYLDFLPNYCHKQNISLETVESLLKDLEDKV